MGHPTLDARRHIVQMFAGGMTQFLTAAQGMPRQIEDALVKMVREFIWDSCETPMIGMGRLYSPISKGGLGLLYIHTRNKAIDVVGLKTYLDLSPSRPKWANLTDAIINTLHPDVPPKPPAFPLTSWSHPSQAPRASSLPFCVLSVIRTAKAARLTFAPLRLSKQLKAQMPVWFHLGAPPRAYHKLRDKCLKLRHKVGRVKNLRSLAKRLNPDSPHQADGSWPCSECEKDRERGCKNPHKCAVTATALVAGLAQKLNPAIPRQKDGLSLTHHRLEKNVRANIKRGDEVIFNPSVTTRTSLADCFRVFTTLPYSDLPANHPPPSDAPQNQLTVFTNGSCVNNGLLDAKCGAGVWVGDQHPLNRSIRVPGPLQSNQVGELAAVLVVLQVAPQTADLIIVTDSRYVITATNSSLCSWKDSGWTNVKNADWLRVTAYHLRRRCAPTRLKWVKGHDGNPGNEAADKLASLGADKVAQDDIDLTVPDHFQPTGLRQRRHQPMP